MNEMNEAFKKLFGDMYLNDSQTAKQIFEYGYKAGVAAENEACAFIASKEAQQWEYPSHANAAAVIISVAIRTRMK